MSNRIKLTSDLDALLPGEDFTIGEQTIVIKPLSLSQVKLIIGRVNALVQDCTEKGITLTNIDNPEKFVQVAELIITKFPDILEELSNIDGADLQKLPIEITIALLDKCIDVNLKSKESLMGNFKSLAQKMGQLGISKEKGKK
jgi:hypothetical protein